MIDMENISGKIQKIYRHAKIDYFMENFTYKMVDIKTLCKLIEGRIRNICDKIKDLH